MELSVWVTIKHSTACIAWI